MPYSFVVLPLKLFWRPKHRHKLAGTSSTFTYGYDNVYACVCVGLAVILRACALYIKYLVLRSRISTPLTRTGSHAENKASHGRKYRFFSNVINSVSLITLGSESQISIFKQCQAIIRCLAFFFGGGGSMRRSHTLESFFQ